MTANQINYARHREDNRHNLETERQGRDVITETHRHNVEQEKIGWGNVGVGYAQVAEAKRHNIATERINWYDVNSQRDLRRKQGSLYDTQRELAATQSKVQQQDADTRRYQAQTEQRKLEAQQRRDEETRRHNYVMEGFQQYDIRTNRMNAETRQSDVASQNWYRQSQILETERHNRRTERTQEQYNQSHLSNERAGINTQIIGTIVGRGGLIGGIGALIAGGAR